MSLFLIGGAMPRLRFPRVSGDEPADTDRLPLDGEFSPRERG